ALRDAGWSYTGAPATGGLLAAGRPGPGQHYAGGADTGVLPASAWDPRGVDSPHDGARPAAAYERSSGRDSAPAPGRQGYDHNQTAKLVDRVRKRIVGDKSCPVYAGPSAGPLTLANSAVMLQDKVMSVLRNIDSGRMRLEPDVFVDGKYTTVADSLTPRRVELLSDL
ncbi:unnamed protein product, partial [Ectocarpus fasciculatus]